MRYMTTSLKTIEKAETNNPEMASEAQKWINTIDIQGDLDSLRGEIINWMLRLRTITISVESNKTGYRTSRKTFCTMVCFGFAKWNILLQAESGWLHRDEKDVIA